MRGLLAAIGTMLTIFALGASPASAAPCLTGTATFLFTGDEQCYEVPAGATGLSVVAVGAPGGDGGGGEATLPPGSGANGARVSALLAVTTGGVLYVEVGGAGSPGYYGPGVPGAAGGFNGGASGGPSPAVGSGGGGGGASDLRTCSIDAVGCDGGGTTLESRLLIASGGGGGGGAAGLGSGGDGGAGALLGEDGLAGGPGSSNPGAGGAGGTASAGGAGGAAGEGCGNTPSQSGQLGVGGAGGASITGGGGGGAGYYGGGGGGGGCGTPNAGAGGGGGGSSFGPVGATFDQDQTGTPLVTIVPRYPLEVTRAGSGSGEVASSPPGIACGQTCSADYDLGAQVTLSAGAAPGSIFAGWSGGGCSGTGDCAVTVEAATQVTASFELVAAACPTVPALCPPGKLFAIGRALVKGKHALLRLRCNGQQGSRCRGVAKVTVRGANPKRGLRRGTVIGKRRYNLPADGARKTLGVRLSKAGMRLVRAAGGRGLKTRLIANGVNRVVKLKLGGGIKRWR